MTKSKKELINYLIKNEDVYSIDEFEQEAKDNKPQIIEYLEWRLNGGKFKNEVIKNEQEYTEACRNLLKVI